MFICFGEPWVANVKEKKLSKIDNAWYHNFYLFFDQFWKIAMLFFTLE